MGNCSWISAPSSASLGCWIPPTRRTWPCLLSLWHLPVCPKGRAAKTLLVLVFIYLLASCGACSRSWKFWCWPRCVWVVAMERSAQQLPLSPALCSLKDWEGHEFLCFGKLQCLACWWGLDLTEVMLEVTVKMVEIFFWVFFCKWWDFCSIRL